MEFSSLMFLIEIPASQLDFEGIYWQLLAQIYNSARHSILKQIVSLNVPFRSWRICYSHVYLISGVIGLCLVASINHLILLPIMYDDV